METPIKIDDLGGTTIFGNTHLESKPHISLKKVGKEQPLSFQMGRHKRGRWTQVPEVSATLLLEGVGWPGGVAKGLMFPIFFIKRRNLNRMPEF